MINIGIMGLGFMAATHIKAYRQVPGCRVAALCNPSGRRLDGDFSSVSGNVGNQDPVKLDMVSVKAFTDFGKMLADPGIDVIDICTPTISHSRLAREALASGKHVLCEKPLTRTSAEAAEIVKLAQAAKGFFMPAMCLRFWPEWAWLKAAIKENRYGKVLGARFRRVAEPPAWGKEHFGNGKLSGGALLDLHIHDTDFVQFCFGVPKSVFSTGYTNYTGAIDHVITQYMFATGESVHAEGSWAMSAGFGFNMSYTVNFENATADYDIARGAESLKLAFEKRSEIIKVEGINGYVNELAYFIECIRTGQRPSLVTAEDGLNSVRICEAEERSIANGEIISLG
jgi:predicted dehydrogenase